MSINDCALYSVLLHPSQFYILLLFALQFGQFFSLYTHIAVKSKMEQTLPHKNHSVCLLSLNQSNDVQSRSHTIPVTRLNAGQYTVSLIWCYSCCTQ